MHEVHFEQFVTARRAPPKRVVLDFDATDIPLRRMQQGRHWHGHYRAYCYLPLYVFAGRHLLDAVLQQSDPDAAHRAGAVLAGAFGCGSAIEPHSVPRKSGRCSRLASETGSSRNRRG